MGRSGPLAAAMDAMGGISRSARRRQRRQHVRQAALASAAAAVSSRTAVPSGQVPASSSRATRGSPTACGYVPAGYVAWAAGAAGRAAAKLGFSVADVGSLVSFVSQWLSAGPGGWQPAETAEVSSVESLVAAGFEGGAAAHADCDAQAVGANSILAFGRGAPPHLASPGRVPVLHTSGRGGPPRLASPSPSFFVPAFASCDVQDAASLVPPAAVTELPIPAPAANVEIRAPVPAAFAKILAAVPAASVEILAPAPVATAVTLAPALAANKSYVFSSPMHFLSPAEWGRVHLTCSLIFVSACAAEALWPGCGVRLRQAEAINALVDAPPQARDR